MDDIQLEQKRLERENFKKGVMTLIAGSSIMLFNGCFFLWANVANYVLSYYYKFDKNIGQGSIFYVDVVLVLVCVFGYQLGTYLLQTKNINPKKIILCGGLVAVSGVLLSTFAKQFWLFVVLYGLIMGIGCGTTYMVPIVCAYDYFPNRKGLVTGIVVGSYGLGSSIFNILATKIVNPNNEGTKIRSPSDPNLSFFGPDVADRVPLMFRLLCIGWTFLVLISAALISRPDKSQSEELKLLAEQRLNAVELHEDSQDQEGEKPAKTVGESASDIEEPNDSKTSKQYNLTHPYACFQSKRFWQYTFMMFAGNVFGGFFSYQYKTIGNSDPNVNNDLVLSEAASASGLVQFFTRLSLGAAYDKLGFKPIFFVLMIINTVNAFICYHVRNVMWIYILCIELNYAVLAGIFALFPAPAIKTFGPKYGPQVYTLILLGSPASSIADMINIKVLYPYFGEVPILGIGGVFSILALVVMFAFKETLDIENLEKKNLIYWTTERLDKKDDDFKKQNEIE